jgi:hypothetical protein
VGRARRPALDFGVFDEDVAKEDGFRYGFGKTSQPETKYGGRPHARAYQHLLRFANATDATA